ncbi:hypothetical protein BDK92_3273 [Micromonospora pisi]|uniref:Uncharacterized protein n=1 Tax=Micromonospora pisi TaxID=589240 RepID=A0A495JLM4_9ACTN|nr:peptidase [Micromonospora pisi]RKR88939.1 hypothetical protein BDK92_3273 [Micromonospora pisi]
MHRVRAWATLAPAWSMTLALICVVAPAAPVGAATVDSENVVGIQLMEAPFDRKDDPRAQTSIVDHLPPAGEIQRKLKISNPTDRRQRVQLYAGAAAVEGERFRFGEGRQVNELASWISLDTDEIDMAVGKTVEVIATVKVPGNALAGERYAVIWASATSAPEPGSTVTDVHRVGVRLYLDIGTGGEPPSSFDIGEFTAGRLPGGQPSLTVRVRNTGGRALDMTGKVSLVGAPGVGAGPFDVVDGTTLAPGESGSVQVALPPDLPGGAHRAEAELASGLVRRTAAAQVAFPAPDVPRSPSALMRNPAVVLGSLLAISVLLLAALVLVLRARRRELAAANQ